MSPDPTDPDAPASPLAKQEISKGLRNTNMERPSSAIFAMRGSIAASKASLMDDDTRDFMADLSRVIAWIDHLESKKEPTRA